jgi:hypothetical protein
MVLPDKYHGIIQAAARVAQNGDILETDTSLRRAFLLTIYI